MLCKGGADIKQKDKDGETALFKAARNGFADCLQTLVDAKADLNERNKKDETPLMLASSNAHVDSVQVLLKAGADVNAAVSRSGETALMQAIDSRYVDENARAQIIEMLRKAGARE